MRQVVARIAFLALHFIQTLTLRSLASASGNLMIYYPDIFVLILYALRDINDSVGKALSAERNIPFSKLFQGPCAVRNLVLFGDSHLCEGFFTDRKDWVVPEAVSSAR